MRRFQPVSLLLAAALAASCSGTGGTSAGGSESESGGAAGGAGAAGAGGGGSTAKGGAAGGLGLGGSGGTSTGCGSDTDGDGIADTLEGASDADGDGLTNDKDDDSDGDGVLDKIEAGSGRADGCSALADSDGDGAPDVTDLDSDGDGVPDKDETAYDPDGSKGCRTTADCDGDGVIDLVEVASKKSNPADKASVPPDSTLYFVLPYKKPEQTKDFAFSSGVKQADIYFLIDTTASMGPAIENVAASIESTILPKILNGDPTAQPPVPAIPGAWVGVGDVRDVPWAPYGYPGDNDMLVDDPSRDWVYKNEFDVGGAKVLGNVTPPGGAAPNFTAPQSVKQILGSLKADHGGDAPEGTTQALWIAATGQPYAAMLGGLWKSKPPQCTPPGSFGTPCFRPETLPIFVVITDAPFHNGPNVNNAYDPATTGGTKTYPEVVDALNAIGAKVVGVPVATGTPGAAREDLKDLAKKTNSVYYDPSFGGSEKPLVTASDTSAGSVSGEVVNLIGTLAGQGIKNVTTVKSNYACAGGVDCTGDGQPDEAWSNPTVMPETMPFDASKLITKVEPIASPDPTPYASIDAEGFYGVRGDATVTFRVHAQNDSINTSSLLVLRAKIQVQTPTKQLLGGAEGVKAVYFVIPPVVPDIK